MDEDDNNDDDVGSMDDTVVVLITAGIVGVVVIGAWVTVLVGFEDEVLLAIKDELEVSGTAAEIVAEEEEEEGKGARAPGDVESEVEEEIFCCASPSAASLCEMGQPSRLIGSSAHASSPVLKPGAHLQG